MAPDAAVPAPPRLPFIDSLRGFALLGVFGANLLTFSGYAFLTDAQQASVGATAADRLVSVAELFFVENKFMGLFSVLFGVSFWLFLDRARARGASATALFYRRVGWLVVAGAMHGWLLWCFDILRFYALWAMLLPLLVGIPQRRLLAIALSAVVLMPAVISGVQGVLAPPSVNSGSAYDAMALAAFSTGGYAAVLSANWAYDWYLTLSIGQVAYQVGILGRLLLGLWAARALNLADLGRHRAALIAVLRVGAVVGAVGNGLFASDVMDDANGFLARFVGRLVIEAGSIGLTLAYAAGLALLFLAPRWTRAITALAPLGRMALTAYLSQTVFGIWLFYGFASGPRLMGKVGPAWLAAVCLAGYAVQIVLAHVWMRRFRLGPAEWLWRTLTYGRLQPIRASGDAPAG